MVQKRSQAPKARSRILTWEEAKETARTRNINHRDYPTMYQRMFFEGILTPQEAIQIEQNRLARISSLRADPERVKKNAILHVSLWFKAIEWLKSAGRKPFKRQLLNEREASEMMTGLEQRLSKKGYFGSLPRLGLTGSVAVFEYNKVPVVVKYTRKNVPEGADPPKLRKSLEVYRAETKRGKILRADGSPIEEKHSRLIMPKVYGTAEEGKYLVMEYLEGIRIETAKEFLKGKALESFNKAYKEAKANLKALEKSGAIEPLRSPQLFHSVLLGNTNPKHPEQGRWIFALPFDAY